MLELRRSTLTIKLPFYLGLLALLGANGGAAASLAYDHDAVIPATLQREILPVWTWGAMVRIQFNHTATPILSAFDGKGSLITNVVLEIPEAYKVDVVDFARGPDGTFAACGWAPDASGRLMGFIAIAPPARPLLVIRTNPYFPRNIAIASDGSLWTASREAPADPNSSASESATPYNVLRHYDQDGALLGSAVPRSSLSSATEILDRGRMAASAGRVGWYTGPTTGELPGSSLRFATLTQRHDSLWAMFPGIERRVANEETIPDWSRPRGAESAAVG